jgi:hypothetical protein
VLEFRSAALRAPSNGSVGWSIEGHIRRFVEAQPGKRWECQADNQWLYVMSAEGIPREQGWKLHISGSVLSAEEILARALPVLVSGACAFKVTKDLDFLESLCASNAPRESAGKFITVYPADDETGGALAAELDARLAGIHGPVVLSDLPYRPASLVSCRYGAFTAMYTLSATGAVRPAIRTPDGALVEDRRRAWFECPPWTSPPAAFRRSAGASRVREPSVRSGQVLLADRFLVIQALRLTAKGGVYLARDLAGGSGDGHRSGDPSAGNLAVGNLVVIKQARPHIGLAADGMDARSGFSPRPPPAGTTQAWRRCWPAPPTGSKTATSMAVRHVRGS